VRILRASVLEATLALVAFLRGRGVKSGQRLGVMVGNHWQLLPMHYAAGPLPHSTLPTSSPLPRLPVQDCTVVRIETTFTISDRCTPPFLAPNARTHT
jgi:hypothetical protein